MPRSARRRLGRCCLWVALCLCAVAGAAQAATLTAEWRFDEATGTEASDSVAGVAAPMLAHWATGSFGSAVYFSDDKTCVASLPDCPALRFGRDSISLSVWLCPTQLAVQPKGQYRRMLIKIAPPSFWTFDVFDSGRVMFGMKDSQGHLGNTVSKGSIAEKRWSLVAIVVDRARFQTRYYFNGKLDSAIPFPKNVTGDLDMPGKPVRVSTWRKYLGLIDSLRFYSGALSAAEIAAQYDAERATHSSAEFTAKPRQRPSFSVPAPKAARQTMWDLAALSRTPKTFPPPAGLKAKEEGVKGIFYESVPFEGKPTRVFAWYGLPKHRTGKVPGMVLVHGGGGTAFSYWVKLWMDRGYAAIAMDTCGCIPLRSAKRRWTRTEHGGPAGWGDFYGLDKPVHDQWGYHAVAAVVVAHSLLRSLPEVDAERTGLTGISWGGYLTSMICGVDTRFKFAVPVYGCGFLGENSAWVGTFASMGRDKATKWLSLWDPSQYLRYAHMPMLFCDGTNDHFYPLDSLQKSYRSIRGPRTLCIRIRMPHGHPPAGDPAEITAFADSILKGKPRLARITGSGIDGDKMWATYECPVSVVKAELCYTTATGNWEKRRWESAPARLDAAARRAEATLPAGTTVCYLNLVDERGLIVSSELEELAK